MAPFHHIPNTGGTHPVAKTCRVPSRGRFPVSLTRPLPCLRVTNTVDCVGTTAYTYDGVGQLLRETGPLSGVSVSNTYGKRLRHTLAVRASGFRAWTDRYYTYDNAGQLKTAQGQGVGRLDQPLAGAIRLSL